MRCLHEYNFQALGESAENLLSEVNDELEQYSTDLIDCIQRISKCNVPPEGQE